jgi:hypothetical protein
MGLGFGEELPGSGEVEVLQREGPLLTLGNFIPDRRL